MRISDCSSDVCSSDLIGMLDVAVGSLCNQAQNYFVSGKTPMRAGNRHPNIQPQDVFPCADGHVVIVVGNDGQYAKRSEERRVGERGCSKCRVWWAPDH